MAMVALISMKVG